MERILDIYCLETPVGWMAIHGDEKFIYRVSFDPDLRKESGNPLLRECAEQIASYFNGNLKRFDLPIYVDGTEFQQKVLGIVRNIPFGKTRTYTEIADDLHNPKAVRAVGQTNGRNPLPILIPCHRVIGNNGALTGYAGGLWRKKWLLKHEFSQSPLPLFS